MWIVETFPLDIRLSAIAKPAWRLPHVMETLGNGGQNSLLKYLFFQKRGIAPNWGNAVKICEGEMYFI